MSVKEHPEYKDEKKRLEYTVKYVESSIEAADNDRKHFRDDMREAFIALDPTDSSLSYSRIMLNGKFLNALEKNYKGLIKAQKKPYFCRIDFKFEDANTINKMYIGKTSLSRAEDDLPLIIDWRAPIASVYYDGRLGEVTYDAPEGEMSGELILKRQYTIEEAKLENIMDVDITTTDTFLQAALGENKDNRLKDIVSTIQSEQNEIIRADIASPLIVQGAAGSGKTTIALHRIAYLIYTYEKNFDPDSFLIIAPNNLFLNYISEVLPELGVEEVTQSTYFDLVKSLSGIKYKLIPDNEKIEKLISLNNKKERKNRIYIEKTSEFKGSLIFKKILDCYISDIENEFCPNEDFYLGEYMLLSKTEIKKVFIEDLSYLSIYKRLDELKKVFRNKIKSEKKRIIGNIETHYNDRIDAIRYTMPANEKRREKIVKLIDERDGKLDAIKKSSKVAVKKYLSLFPKKDVIYYYRKLLSNQDKIKEYMKEEKNNKLISYVCKYTLKYLANKKIEYEDLTPLMYLKYRIFGLDKKMDIKYVVVDEAQDFSVFQLYTLKKMFNTELFTILGDLAQGIHSYRGIKDWEEILGNIFESKKKKYLKLEQSYRTTIEIMEAANEVLEMAKIPGTVLAKPVVRHGEKPKISKCKTKTELCTKLEQKICDYKALGYKTIAVVAKTQKECKKIKRLLSKKIKNEIKLLSTKNTNYEGGTILLPSYLAKGLEFDAVIIVSLDEDYYKNELDLKLLYVAMTRALHDMNIICLESQMELLCGNESIEYN